MTLKHNRINHHYFYYQGIVLNCASIGLRGLQYGNLDEILGF